MIVETVDQIHRNIFRAYDIRGIVGESLTTDIMSSVGKALGTIAFEMGEKRLAFGRDGRASSPGLAKALALGILSTGCDVIDLGMIPTPLLYYATHVLETASGVMVTGSHNPAEYNGVKMMLGGETLSENGIQHILNYILKSRFREGEGQLSELDITERYMVHLERDIKLKRPLKVVVDCGNGVAGCMVPELYRRLGCDVIELFCDVNGQFPNHHPDPSQVENLQDLIRKVTEVNADVGLAFDGDGDRLGVVTNRGEIIWPDRQLMLFAKDVLSRHPQAKIIYDVKCSQHLATLVEACGGVPIMWKTGHSLIKAKLVETQAALAGEMSGHIFFRDRWYGFDDAIYAGGRLLQILSEQSQGSHHLFSDIPNSINTPELKVYVDDAEKFSLMNTIIEKAQFTGAEQVTIDGLRVNFNDGWGLVRPSNTTPCLILRFEAENETGLTRIQNIFRDLLFSVKADLVLPF